MWHLLGIISNNLRRDDPAVSNSTPLLSPPMPVSHDIEPWRTELIESIYRYSILKTLTRFDKWWGELVGFVKLFEGREVSNASGLKDRFIDAVYVISESRPTLEKIRTNTHIPFNEWKDLIYAMDATIPDVLAILSNQNQCEEWANELQGLFPHVLLSLSINLIYCPEDNPNPFRLRRAIEKLTTQHRHIHVLLRFAHSPRLRSAFLTPLSVLAIPTPPQVSISLPSTPIDWQSLIEAVCNGYILTSDKWLTDEVMKLSAHFQRGRYNGVVHCECALIAHFETTHSDPPPFSYIGVSKLSCRGCHAWIQAFNAAGGRQYRTQGTHGKWYFPWAMPARGAATTLLSHVARILREKYIKFWTSEGKLYSASDSSDASGKGGRAIIGKEVDDVRREVLERGKARGLLK